MKILMIDVGGSNVKLMATGHEGRRKVPSGPRLTAAAMVREVLKATEDWEFEAISLGFPGLVSDGRPAREPLNLGGGWLSFDYDKAFKRPVRFINDAPCRRWRAIRKAACFFSASARARRGLIVDDVIIPLEIGVLRLTRHAFHGCACDAARQRNGANAG